uniref:Amine oxidase n=1 Tax=Chromera velia CCMP2878 TaxID=1169474 RepID=A0A0G4HRT8_9ALVE|eukprot:Cvel_30792.t1-p1 / transcript=Cvel_30792.t1 / gene=Cvel_30792 / organism=Chromera_velia_CCMP2878 / gene_product=Copper methylamine oxidase, putative / transcript_product=Copper methylamine oxidase, putative / location=Cvel_scaffold4457:8189-9530(+) / protein_length=344 / sequence_SO=supercontig / SO=protein_coding / is_pseudo=false
MSMCTPLQPLSAAEVFQSRDAILATAAKQGLSQHVFGYISLLEPSGDELRAFEKSGTPPARKAEAVVHLSDGAGVRKPFKAYATLKGSSAEVSLSPVDTEKGWPLFSLHECDLAEKLVMDSPEVHKLLKETYKMDESAIKRLKVDPWGIHGCHWSPVSAEAEKSRVMMCLMYLSKREDCKDNFYAHPLDFLCYVDLYEKKLLHIQKCEKGGKVPREASEYHRALVDHSKFDRSLKPLEIVQPEGPSFEVEGNGIKWNRWSLNISFNYREGLVLHNLKFDGRPVLRRACLSEMAVPYADPFPPHIHKCAFDVGDYGLGYFATSLNLGCDCLGRVGGLLSPSSFFL